jgi:hypothetical protein
MKKSQITRYLQLIIDLSSKKHIAKSDYVGNPDDEKIPERNFERMISNLKNVLPIKYNHKAKYYEIDRSANVNDSELIVAINDLDMQDDLLFFYSFVKSMVSSEYFLPPLSRKATDEKVSDFEVILNLLKSKIKPEDKLLCDSIDYYISEHYKIDNKVKFMNTFDCVIGSLRNDRYLKFKYDNGQSLAWVIAAPLKLVYYNGKWFIIAYMRESDMKEKSEWGRVRTYNFSHISSIKVIDEYFTEDRNAFNIDYRESFGFYMDEKVKEAKIRFFGKAKREVQETIWHSSFKEISKDKDNDYIEMKLDYPELGSVELISKVLSYGENAEIVSPPELVSAWKKTIKAMYKRAF